jgi:hypothetical protein
MDQMDQKVLDALTAECRAVLASGGTQENVIELLRAKTSSKIVSIRVLTIVFSLALPRAKELVDNSPAWKDRKEDDDNFHRTLRRLEG